MDFGGKDSRLISVTLSIFIIFSYFSASAQENIDRCIKQCARQAKKEVRSCKNLSLDCFNDNTFDPLAILDYCSEAFLGSCESNVKETYAVCLQDQCGIDLVSYRNDQEFDALNGSSNTCSTNGTSVINPILTELQTEVNKVWDTVACTPEVGLCPLEPVFDGKIGLGCSADGTDGAILSAECLVLNTNYPFCDGFWVDTDIEKLEGLQNLQFSNTMVTEITGSTGTQTCPYDAHAEGGSFECSYYGKGTVSASLKSGTELKLVDTSFKVRLKCSNGFDSTTHTLYDGNFTCETTNPTGTATYDLCAGDCESNLGGVITYLKIPSKGNLTLHPGNLSCVFDPKTNPVNWFLDAFVPLFEDQIAKALEGPLAIAINEVLPPMPFPASCSN